MVLSRKQMLLWAFGLVVCGVAGVVALQKTYERFAGVVLGIVSVSTLLLWWAYAEYRKYEHGRDSEGRELRLVTRNTALAKLLKRRLPSSGTVAQINKRLYYRSQGHKTHRTPWPRLWIVEMADFPKLDIGQKQAVKAHVVWPGPFRGGIFWRHGVWVDIQRTGLSTYSFNPDGLPKRDWLRLRSVSAKQLEALANDLERIIRDVERIGNRNRIGGRNRFQLMS